MDMTEIFLYNTLAGKKEKFEPIEQGFLKMYNCGPTVYSFPTIGNMRAYIFADTIRRVFEYNNYKVKQVINITDVGHLTSDSDTGEDKIEESAKKEEKSAAEISKIYEDAFYKDLENLNIETESTIFPKATEHIEEQIEIIKILEEKGFAYKISDGVYFDTSKFKGYGKLGNIKIENQKEGARVETNDEKRNPADFALWKFSTGERRLQEWPSPWGVGFPGWHIECSAMSRKYLGQPFDIHTGGIDHIPVHHNNEIAQSEAAFEKPLANFWIHNEFIQIEGQKMSKSLGNVFTISDLKSKGIHPLAFRLWILSGHYRSPMNFTWDSVKGAQTALEKIVTKYAFELNDNDLIESEKKLAINESEMRPNVIEDFEKNIFDDLDIPAVLPLLFSPLVTEKKTIDTIDRVLGLNIKKLSEQIKEIPEEILKIKNDRDLARQEKNWEKSDELRVQIENLGFILEDKPNETLIRKSLASLI